MAYDRNRDRETSEDKNELLEKLLETRNLKFINHYKTPKFREPTKEELAQVNTTTEVWKLGDKLYKYAQVHYGNERYWWVIAWFNRKPSEHHFKIGDTFFIPDLNELLDYMYYETSLDS